LEGATLEGPPMIPGLSFRAGDMKASSRRSFSFRYSLTDELIKPGERRLLLLKVTYLTARGARVAEEEKLNIRMPGVHRSLYSQSGLPRISKPVIRLGQERSDEELRGLAEEARLKVEQPVRPAGVSRLDKPLPQVTLEQLDPKRWKKKNGLLVPVDWDSGNPYPMSAVLVVYPWVLYGYPEYPGYFSVGVGNWDYYAVHGWWISDPYVGWSWPIYSQPGWYPVFNGEGIGWVTEPEWGAEAYHDQVVEFQFYSPAGYNFAYDQYVIGSWYYNEAYERLPGQSFSDWCLGPAW